MEKENLWTDDRKTVAEVSFARRVSPISADITITDFAIERPVVMQPKGTGVRPVVAYHPLDKIWSCLRRRILEEYGASICGIFRHDDLERTIACQFYLDFRPVEKQEEEELRAYASKFQDSFDAWTDYFVKHLMIFMQAENGYAKYQKMVQDGITDERAYDKFFNAYLKAAGLRTQKDESRSAREKAKAEKRSRAMTRMTKPK